MRRWDDVPHLVRTGWHYPRAPIVEAIIEIRCTLPPETSLATLAAAADRENFPVAEPTVTVTGMLEFSPEGLEQRTTGEQTGHLFRSSDGRTIIQSRLDGFSFGRLAPYERWDSFSAATEHNWHRYREIAQPTRVQRLGVRYINRIDVPGDHVEIKDYLRTAVDVSPYLPQMLREYFFQIVVPLPKFRAYVTITSAIAPAASPDATGLILDIDTWQVMDLDLAATDASTKIATSLESLRAAKNYVFEACITDATRRLIE